MSREHTFIFRTGAVSCCFQFDPAEKLSKAKRKRTVESIKKLLVKFYWKVPKNERDQFCVWGGRILTIAGGAAQEPTESGFDLG